MLEVKVLCNSSSEILKALCGGTTRQGLVAAIDSEVETRRRITELRSKNILQGRGGWGKMDGVNAVEKCLFMYNNNEIFFFSLCIGLLQESTPELPPLRRVDKHQFTIFDWETVINHHIHPLSKLPELQIQLHISGFLVVMWTSTFRCR